jgi:hypothetical protein
VSRSRASVAARGRGVAAGALTAALAAVAHGWASGVAPSGSGLSLLGVLGVSLGALAATMRATATLPGLLAVLSVGQLIGHVLLGVSGHHHTAAGPSGAAMTGAHIAAVVVCAALIAAAYRFGEALSRTVRAVAVPHVLAVPAAADAVARSADQPLQATRLLATSLSHRGPPVPA